jgi:DNA-binding LacI/PurR family transcriptional regulator
MIEKNEIQPGTLFYSVNELSSKYNVSNITSRRVLNELNQMGIIDKSRGRKCFVKNINKEIKILFPPSLDKASMSQPSTSIYELFRGINNEAQRNHSTIKIVNPKYYDGRLSAEELLIIIYAPELLTDEFAKIIEKANFCVCCGSPCILKNVSTVRYNISNAISKTVQKLIISGHSRIALVTGNLNNIWFSQRFDGYYQELKRNNIPLDLALIKEIKSYHSEKEDFNIIEDFFKLSSPPSAIIAINDTMALNMLDYCKHNNIVAPDNISIIGFGNSSDSGNSKPTLTTIDNKKYDQGVQAVKLLLQMTAQNEKTPKDILLEPELVIRESLK